MQLFDWMAEIYDYLLPHMYTIGVAAIGLCIIGLVGDVWYLHGGQTTGIALVLVLGGVCYVFGQRYKAEGRENEAKYDPNVFN
jgi:hypothetical protein